MRKRQHRSGTTDNVATSPELDAIFHQPVRTRLSALLRRKEHSFSELKRELGVTDGNLDAHLRKLSAAGYLSSRMIVDGRPHTLYGLSSSGKTRFDAYRKTLAKVLR